MSRYTRRKLSTRVLRTSELSPKNTIIRAGVIFYTLIDNQLHFCFGRDNKSSDLTDFGGGRKKSESVSLCALREAFEESRKVFGVINEQQIGQCPCLTNNDMAIIFIPVIAKKFDIRIITQNLFHFKYYLTDAEYKCRCYNEMSSLEWLDTQQFFDLLEVDSAQSMYTKVKNLFLGLGIRQMANFMFRLNHIIYMPNRIKST